MKIQNSTGIALNLNKNSSSDVLGAWVFTLTNDYPRIKQLLVVDGFGELLPILVAAIDATSLVFTSIADADSVIWYPQKSIGNSDIDTIRNGRAASNQKSCIATTITGGGNVSFV